MHPLALAKSNGSDAGVRTAQKKLFLSKYIKRELTRTVKLQAEFEFWNPNAAKPGKRKKE